MSVPKYLAGFHITFRRACDRIVQTSQTVSHNEDADDSCDVIFHLTPFYSTSNLLTHKIENVEIGTCLEKLLVRVLHLYQDRVAGLCGAMEVERHASLINCVSWHLHVFKCHTCDFLHVSL